MLSRFFLSGKDNQIFRRSRHILPRFGRCVQGQGTRCGFSVSIMRNRRGIDFRGMRGRIFNCRKGDWFLRRREVGCDGGFGGSIWRLGVVGHGGFGSRGGWVFLWGGNFGNDGASCGERFLNRYELWLFLLLRLRSLRVRNNAIRRSRTIDRISGHRIWRSIELWNPEGGRVVKWSGKWTGCNCRSWRRNLEARH